MNSKIFLFFVNSDLKYEIYIYDFSLNKLNSNSIIIDSIYNFNQGYGVFSKCYNIIDNLAIFIYYTNPNTKILKLKIGKIDSDYVFNEMLTKEISEYTFQIDVLLNDFVKVNEERFIYIGLSESTFDTISLLLFDLYNNYNNMKIRLYEINLNNKYEVNMEFSIDIYNNILALTSTVVNKGSSNQFSIFILFGYANGTDSFIDISEYFMDDYIHSSKNIVSKLFENIIIENNIFGYELISDKIILSSIPNEILFYNKTNENIKLENEDFLDINYILKQNEQIIKYDKYYSLDYQFIIQEPNYETFNDNSKNIIDYPDINSDSYIDQENFFNQKIFYGRTNTITFKLCYNFCETCNKYGISNDTQHRLSCLPDYRYDYFKNNTSNCVPEGYFYDMEEKKLYECNNTNSKYYFNLTDNNKRICFKFSYPCPSEYPYLNTSTNECLPIFRCTYVELLYKLCSFFDYNNTEIYYKIINEVLLTYPSINGESLVIEGKENYVFQLTTGK